MSSFGFESVIVGYTFSVYSSAVPRGFFMEPLLRLPLFYFIGNFSFMLGQIWSGN